MADPEPDAVSVPLPVSVEAVLRELALFELRCDGADVTDKREGRGNSEGGVAFLSGGEKPGGGFCGGVDGGLGWIRVGLRSWGED